MVKEYLPQLHALAEHYDALAKEHGYSHNAVQQSSHDSQMRRFKILLEGFSNIEKMKILDFGCGAGHLYALLKELGFSGEYVGYDISQELVALARKNHPDARFEIRNIFEQRPVETFDLVFISGVFNNEMGKNPDFLQDTLQILFPLCQVGMAFNCLSTYVDFKAEGLFYFDPCSVFDFCKQHLTPSVVLRHDYEIKEGVVPFEFSCYLKTSVHSPRKNNYV